MALDYTTCPHCGCSCEDDEYCAACGKLFHEDTVPTGNVSIFGLLESGLRSKSKKFKIVGHPVDFGGDTCLDPEYSSIPGNVAHNLYDDE